MKRITYTSLYLGLALAIGFASCNRVDNWMPKGDPGAPGASAYEIWKEELKKGNIAGLNPQESTLQHFFLYMQGHNGTDNTDNPYEQWKKMIAQGNTTNPHKPDELWPADKTNKEDFWNFLTGTDGNPTIDPNTGNWVIKGRDTRHRAVHQDGQDAYELWKQMVQVGEIKWNMNETSLSDFYRYLKADSAKEVSISPDGYWVIGTDKQSQKVTADSAYDLWVAEVKKGTLTQADGKTPWDPNKTSRTDFYNYLRGSNGEKGDDAYAVWKAEAEKGNLTRPAYPDQVWPADEVTKADFYRFLLGKDGNPGPKGPQGDKGEPGDKGKPGDKGPDGRNGIDGLGVYDMWKADLEAYKDTPEALVDFKTGKPWDTSKNSLNDFYDFITGRQGVAGRDGKPGEPGTPGKQIVQFKGRPNVLIQYYMQDKSEYINPETGLVTYKVYTKDGKIAPEGTTVKGLPGLDPNTIFTVKGDQGEFTIKNSELPIFDTPLGKVGPVAEVTPPSGTAEPSAPNTFIPSRVQVKIDSVYATFDKTGGYGLNHRLYVKIKRAKNSDWEDLPYYFPNRNLKLELLRVMDKTNLSSATDKAEKQSTSYDLSFVNIFRPRAIKDKDGKRYVADNYFYKTTALSEIKYYTHRLSGGTLYGETLRSNTIVEFLPWQKGPVLKNMVLRKKSTNNGYVIFKEADGEFDFSHIDWTIIPKDYKLKATKNTDGSTLLSAQLYTEEEAKNLKMFYMSANIKDGRSNVITTTIKNMSSGNAPQFRIFDLYAGSQIVINPYTEERFASQGQQDFLRIGESYHFNGFKMVGKLEYSEKYQTWHTGLIDGKITWDGTEDPGGDSGDPNAGGTIVDGNDSDTTEATNTVTAGGGQP